MGSEMVLVISVGLINTFLLVLTIIYHGTVPDDPENGTLSKLNHLNITCVPCGPVKHYQMSSETDNVPWVALLPPRRSRKRMLPVCFFSYRCSLEGEDLVHVESWPDRASGYGRIPCTVTTPGYGTVCLSHGGVVKRMQVL